MTREVAIDILKCGRPFDDNPKADLDDFNLALGVAIKAIKNENDLIDRVLETLDKEIDLYRQLEKPDNQHRDVISALVNFRKLIVKLKEGEQE